MRFAAVAPLVLLWWSALPQAGRATQNTGAAPDDLAGIPQAGAAATVPCTGEALGRYLPRAGEAYGVRLTASRDLAAQRLTVCGGPITLRTLTTGLVELLGVRPAGTVFWSRLPESLPWTRSRDRGWQLSQSRSRRQLAATLSNSDQDLFLQHLSREVSWLRERAPAELAAAGDERRRAMRLERAMNAALLAALGGPELERFLSGGVLIRKVRDLGEPARSHFHEWLQLTSSIGRQAPPEYLDDFRLVFLRERRRTGLQPGGVTMALVSPKGLQHQKRTLMRPSLSLLALPPVPAGVERRVTVKLTDATRKSGEPVLLEYHDVLKQVALQAGITILADGYLRPPATCRNGYEWRDIPLDTLLHTLVRKWDCSWRFLDARKQTVLVRTRQWWLEDAADVPEPQVQQLRRRFARNARPSLEDLVDLAELEPIQIRKLVECDACPAAQGLIDLGFCDDTGAARTLRFWHRLLPAQRARVRSDSGLRLGDADPRLVDELLGPTLASDVGAIDPADRAELRFRIEEMHPKATLPAGGWRLSVRHPDRFRSQGGWILGFTPMTDSPLFPSLP